MFAQWLRLATAAHPHPRHLNKVLGFIQWHVRPCRGMGPFLAGAYCWQRWGTVGQPVPLKVLHGLATAIVFAMEPWSPHDALQWSLKCAMGRPVNLHRHAFATMFVDAALDVFPYRVGLFLPGKYEVRSVVIPPNRHTQQSAELWGFMLGNAAGKAVGLEVFGFGYRFASGGSAGGLSARAYLAA